MGIISRITQFFYKNKVTQIQWHHLSFVNTKGKNQLFIDGKLFNKTEYTLEFWMRDEGLDTMLALKNEPITNPIAIAKKLGKKIHKPTTKKKSTK